MATVKQLLEFKKKINAHTVDEMESIAEAINRMNTHDVGALMVTDSDGQFSGIITERDILRNVVEAEFDLCQTPVHRWMTRRVVCCSVETSIQDVEALMSRHRMRHLPVFDDDDRCVGLISMQDVNRFQAHDRELAIRYLEDYLMYCPN